MRLGFIFPSAIFIKNQVFISNEHLILNVAFLPTDGMTHWHQKTTPVSSSSHHWTPPHQQGNPVDIEMTSYALLVFATKSEFTHGLPLMKWISKQRNPRGGFSSTQVYYKEYILQTYIWIVDINIKTFEILLSKNWLHLS